MEWGSLVLGMSRRVLLTDRPRRLRLFYRQEAGGGHGVGKWLESLPFQEGSIGSCWVTIHNKHICILYSILFKLVCG